MPKLYCPVEDCKYNQFGNTCYKREVSMSKGLNGFAICSDFAVKRKTKDENVRKVEVYDADYQEWVGLLFEDVAKGDIFRLFEPDGTLVINNGCSTYMAISDSYVEKGIWTINCETINMENVKTLSEKTN